MILINTNIIYVATYFNVYKSTDGGDNFTSILSTNNYIQSIEIDFTESNLWVLDSYRLHHSTDEGDNWTSEIQD